MEEVDELFASFRELTRNRRAIATIAALDRPHAAQAGCLASDIERLCREAVQFGFASVCVNPWYVPLAGAVAAAARR